LSASKTNEYTYLNETENVMVITEIPDKTQLKTFYRTTGENTMRKNATEQNATQKLCHEIKCYPENMLRGNIAVLH